MLNFVLMIISVMSSQDSISMVLKCMLKGAADFLTKPVRRNELRNLWQHVWRRHTVCTMLNVLFGFSLGEIKFFCNFFTWIDPLFVVVFALLLIS